MMIFVGDNEDSAVLAAAEDLQADLREVTGVNLPIGSYSGYREHTGFVICTVDCGDEPLITQTLGVDARRLSGQRESFLIEKRGRTILVMGSDLLGTVFGVYHVCEHLLGVDPLRFWTEMPPLHRSLDEIFARAEVPVRFDPPVIPIRGWFVNEDDLIRQFDYGDRRWDSDPSGHDLGLKSPYLIPNPQVVEGAATTLLRLKQNLFLPGTYVCPRDTLWHELMLMAARRGLHNTTQHFQPLGCWPVSFDRYWSQRGSQPIYSWLSNREALVEAWHAFASRMAPLRPLWQVGYRGRDDAPFWETEEGAPESRQERAAVVSEVIAAQVEVARQHDPDPILTYFLWAEGDPLYRSGALKLPEEVIVVFSDYGRTSMMKEGFWQHEPGSRAAGTYYHLGFWSTGPTNHMGVSTEKIAYNLRHAFEKKATDYLLVNVASVREHLMGASALARIAVTGPEAVDPDAHDHQWCVDRWGTGDGAEAAKLYRRFFDALPRSPSPSKFPQFPKLIHDGALHKLSALILGFLSEGEVSDAAYATEATARCMRGANLYGVIDEGQDQGFEPNLPEEMAFAKLEDFLTFAAETCEKFIADMEALEADIDRLSARMQRPGGGRFLRSHLGGQAAMMRLLADLVAGPARAALAMHKQNLQEARQILEQTDGQFKPLMGNWHGKYEGRFASWPVARCFVSLEEKQRQIREILGGGGFRSAH